MSVIPRRTSNRLRPSLALCFALALGLQAGGVALVSGESPPAPAPDSRIGATPGSRSAVVESHGESYAAHIAAAAASLELDRTAEALDWLSRAPAAPRGWEWEYLTATASEQLTVLSTANGETPAGAVTRLAIAPGGAILAAGTAEGEVLLWNLPEGSLERRFPAHDGEVRGLAFSPTGDVLASSGSDKVLRLHALAAEHEDQSWSLEVANLQGLAWSPSGRSLAAGAWERDPESRRPRGVLLVGDPRSFETAERRGLPFFVSALATSPDGRWIAAGNPLGAIAIWPAAAESGGMNDIREPVQVLQISRSLSFPFVEDLAFSPDSATLIAGIQDGSIRRWALGGDDAARWEALEPLLPRGRNTARPVEAIAPSHDGTVLASGSSDGLVRLWRLGGGEGADRAGGETATEPGTSRETSAAALLGEPEIATLRGHLGPVTALVAEPGGGGFWSGSADGTVRRWPAWPEPFLLDHQGEAIWGFDLSPDERRAATLSSAGTLRLWDLATRREIWRRDAHQGEASALLFTHGGRRLVSSGNDGALRVWDAASGDELGALEQIGDGRAVGISLSPDGRWLAAGSSRGTAKIWDLSGEALPEAPARTLGGHEGEIWRLLWATDGSFLISAATDGVIQVFSTTSWETRLRFEAHAGAVHGATLSPDETLLATSSADRSVRIWKLEDGSLLRTITGHEERVYDVAWSPDGRRLATASNDFTVRLWDATTGHPLLRIPFTAQIYRVVWSRDGRALFAVPMNGRVERLGGS